MKDQYAVLGVQRSASDEEIKAAYRRLAGQPENRGRLEELEEALKLLTDPGARDIYDQTLRFAAEAPRTPLRPAAVARPLEPEPEVRSSSRFWVMLVLAAVVAGGLSLYAHFSKEQERLRLEREREIHIRAEQAEAERQRREAAALAAQEEAERRRELERLDRENRLESQRALREVERRSEQEWQETQRQSRREAQEAKQREREEQYAKEREERLRREREAHNRWIIERPFYR